jgi:hypothetical protein
VSIEQELNGRIYSANSGRKQAKFVLTFIDKAKKTAEKTTNESSDVCMNRVSEIASQ